MMTTTTKRSSLRALPLIASLLLGLAAGPARAQAPGETEFRTEAEARGYVPEDLPLKPVPPRRFEQSGPQTVPIVRRVRPDQDGQLRPVQGALSGKSVYLSPGHGWTYASGWTTQRGNNLGLVEDLSNADGIDQFLVPLLLRAGALVVGVRELDPTAAMVILDDSDGTSAPARGQYTEQGDAALFSDSTLAGWGQPTFPITDQSNPFELGGNRLMETKPTETARVSFVPNVPSAGYYNVYIAYSQYSGRASDAQFTVAHPGGQTSFLVDQRRHGGTWVLLGRFYFEAGTDEKRGAVIVSNASQDSGSNISVDAVRLGGGTGVIDRGGGVSGKARCDENSRYHAQFSGAPSTVYNSSSSGDGTDDVSSRSRFADWVHAPGEPAVYISHHSNAYNGAIRGTESYIYGPNPPNGSYQPTSAALALGADKLGQAVHGAIIDDIKADFDADWTDRKLKSAYFGEINPSYQDEMASVLVETAFHDQPDDVDALKEPHFRQLVARAIYKGIVRYFAGLEGNAVHLLPEPPRKLSARNLGGGQVELRWQPSQAGGVLGDAATSYLVQRSDGGFAFDEGTDSMGATTLTLSGLPVGQVVYLRVVATNQGGESLPSTTLAVGVSAADRAPVLLVNGSDRLDASMNLQVTDAKLGTKDRLWPNKMNSGDYLVQHGQALAPSGVPFDSCEHGAVDSGTLALRDYQLVLWQGGRGLSGELGLTPDSITALKDAAAAGVGLFLSGSRLAGWLEAGGGAGAQLLAETLGASFAQQNDSLVDVAPAAGSALAALDPWSLSTWQTGPYDALPTDELSPGTDALLAASYGTSGSAGAAIELNDSSRCALLLGHPLETILPAERQAEILKRVLDRCQVEPPVVADGGLPLSDGAAASDGGPAADGNGAGPPKRGDDGCSCALTGPPGSSPAMLGLLGLVLLGLLGRRRQRR